jgi:hypothetical protein
MWLVVLGLAGCSSGPCDDAQLSEVTRALGSVSAEFRVQLASQGLAEACTLPDPIERGLTGIPAAPPTLLPMLDLQVAAEAPEVWKAACPGGPEVLADAATKSDGDARERIWSACDLAAKGWPKDKYLSASGARALPVMLEHLLADEREFDRRMVIDAIAGAR